MPGYFRIRAQSVEKGFAEFAAKSGKHIFVIFARDVYVGKNTSQAASVEFVRHKGSP